MRISFELSFVQQLYKYLGTLPAEHVEVPRAEIRREIEAQTRELEDAGKRSKESAE